MRQTSTQFQISVESVFQSIELIPMDNESINMSSLYHLKLFYKHQFFGLYKISGQKLVEIRPGW